ncbi:hypothetical protein M3231_21370 [Neobacillus mesonae]|nr:hypothetical protein [Neobacillus mesonae]
MEVMYYRMIGWATILMGFLYFPAVLKKHNTGLPNKTRLLPLIMFVFR